ncbi:hypothetical protein BAUCODRAFT_461052 [Baudoinia panamericana UAMH 10762]|uniref:Prion-inhibition and propagation HeLo domain-containing protein n=1 Tax=Baudoinia panamericana (strain UAMH 10762) TaxID=717646 RepID=M2NEI9_BAUPA|nr:uncharacterized protein BAUCODRAFT_461052 [Baudoinia panamericana UAMH 10762]EMC97659.1 hypothetical protein BAUCODRAFT_461052 [Baudoinia panamericana UAMH 10762]
MAHDKADSAHVEHPEHEAALAGALALANLFSNCVEAFGLIHPSHKSEKEEQLLLSRLGLQQARLLIWGDIVGVSSPPKNVTDRAVPKHPSAQYPDLNEPTFFGPRDTRLDEEKTRTEIENALSAIVDRSSGQSREQMMEKYGLKPPKRALATQIEPALDIQRLDGFRERFALLKEVVEDYAQLNTRRSNSIVQTSWMIADSTRFGRFITLTQEKVDYLITLMDIKERVDRAMRIDIRSLGWHLAADRQRVALDASKLRLLQEHCRTEYPEYLDAVQQALNNIQRETRENAPVVNPYAAAPRTEKPLLPKSSHTHANGERGKQKPPSIFSRLTSFGKSKDKVPQKGRAQSIDAAMSDPPRSLSDAGPTRYDADDDGGALEPIRSKSVGHIMEGGEMGALDEDFINNRLAQMRTTDPAKEPLENTDSLAGQISRHDQYHGIARTQTKDLRQGW